MALQRFVLFYVNLLVLIILHNSCALNSIYEIEETCENNNNTCQKDLSSFLSTTTTTLDLKGTKEYEYDADGRILNFSSKINITQSKPNCPPLTETQGLSQLQLLELLTAACRYDRFIRPKAFLNGTITAGPVDVFILLDISVSYAESSSTQLKADGLLQLRYFDTRLAYAKISPERESIIILEQDIINMIWVPRFYFTAIGQNLPLTQTHKVILTNISPDGFVDMSIHLTTNLNCKMQLQKFPFDEQYCNMLIENWLYNASDVIMTWNKYKPIKVESDGLTDFVIEYMWSNDTILVGNMPNIIPNTTKNSYAALNFTIYLRRQSGYYIMQYFLPSMMIVAISWVSFWLQADQTPARTTLGTTTLLSFITLGSSIEQNVPKVNYIKISEIWFFSCIAFIFCSLVEFAFVNTIWRRKNNVALKRISSRQILKKTLTPQNNRQKGNTKMRKIKSVSSVLTVNDAEKFSYISNNPDSPYATGSTDPMDNPFTFNIDANISSSSNININNNNNNSNANLNEREPIRNQTLSSMTPHEVSLWIDRKARFAFPLAFIIFNAIFWTFAMLLQ